MKLFQLFIYLIISNATIGQIQKDRLYIQSDKDYYVAGEIIWLKSYVIPSTDVASSNLFVDLYNKSGRLIDSILLPAIGNTATGNITIPSSVPEGIYFLYCYTNSGRIRSFQKKLFICNPYFKDSTVLKNPDPSFTISPNYIVAGTENTVYFKCSIQSPAKEIKGTIFNSKKEAIVRFKSLYNEYGQIDLTPEAGETYFIQLDLNDSIEFFKLPVPLTKAVSIQTTNTANGKLISINIPPALRSNQTLTIQGSVDQTIVFTRTFIATRNTYLAYLVLDSAISGVLNLTVKDENGSTLGNKSVFINNPLANITIGLKADTVNFNSGGYNSFSLVFPDSTIGNFSISIVDEDQHKHFGGTGILSSMFSIPGLTCTDISPLLKQHSISNNAILDLLSNFKKEDLITTTITDNEFITIKGTVVSRKTKELVTKGTLDFMIRAKDSSLIFVSTPIAKDGSFVIRGLVFFDTASFYYSLKGNPNEEILIQLDSSHPDYYNRKPLLATCAGDDLFFNDSLQNKIMRTYISLIRPADSGKLLKEVTIKTKRLSTKDQLNKDYTHGLFRNSNTSYIVDLINDPPNASGLNVFDYLQGRIPGLIITRTSDGYQLKSNRNLSIFYEPPVRLYLNEQETSGEFLAIIQVQDVAMVKYFSPGTSSLPGVGISGVLAVYTKIPGKINNPSFASNGSFVYNGYSPIKDFDLENRFNANDYLSTIYWNPNILIDGTNNVFQIKFINNNAKRFHLTAEGVTIDGKILHFEKLLK